MPALLAVRKGQCVIMPIAFLVIGQLLGLPLTITTAPYHVIVKYGDEEQGQWTSERFVGFVPHRLRLGSGFDMYVALLPVVHFLVTFALLSTRRKSAA